MTVLDCVIVGAGAAGLAAGRRLARAGVTFALLEAQARTGGRAHMSTQRGFRIEHGAAFLTSFYPRALALAAEAGVALDSPGFHPGRYARAQALLIDARLRPHNIGTPRGFLAFPFVPLRHKLRTGLTILRDAVCAGLHVAEPASLARYDDEDAHAWARHALGETAYEYFVRTAFEPFFFDEMAECSAAVARALLAHALRWRLLALHAGMGVLMAGLSRGLPVIPEARVQAIARSGATYSIETAQATLRARAVILACPPPALVRMQLPLDAADTGMISRVQLVPSVRVNLGYPSRDVLRPPGRA